MTTLDPGASGWIVVTDRRHDGTGTLPGCPEHDAVFNDPDQLRAEYLAGSVAAAKLIYRRRAELMGVDRIRLKRPPDLVEAAFPGEGTYADGLHYVPVPLTPTNASRQWGQLWATQGHQGVSTTLPVAYPPGTANRWTCVFLRQSTSITVVGTQPLP